MRVFEVGRLPMFGGFALFPEGIGLLKILFTLLKKKSLRAFLFPSDLGFYSYRFLLLIWQLGSQGLYLLLEKFDVVSIFECIQLILGDIHWCTAISL